MTPSALKIPEACARLNVSRTALYDLINTGQIRVLKIGTRGVRIAVAELDRFISQGVTPHQQEAAA